MNCSKNRLNYQLLLSVFLSLLIGCSGGEDTQNNALTSINAGPDRTTRPGEEVTLSASASPSGGTFSWTQLKGDTLESFPAASESVTFTMPPTVSKPSLFSFKIVYKTSSGTVEDIVEITVEDEALTPIAKIAPGTPNTAPYSPSTLLKLDGTNSYDQNPLGTIKTYLWSQVSGQKTLNFRTALDASNVTLIVPLGSSDQSYQVKLIVTNDKGLSAETVFEFTAQGSSIPVIAHAGDTLTKPEFSKVTLDGSGSQSLNGTLNCTWQQVSGPTATITNANQCQTEFTAPDVSGTESAVFSLLVEDGQANSDTASVTHQLIPFDFGKVQDTGILSCFDVDSTEPCTSEAVKEQDAKSGRDSVASLLFKTGTGTGGFDFTKLDINGDEVPDTATIYSCIRDNVSGLIWEVKLPATDTPPNSAIRSGINRYSWNLADVPNNGGKGVAADARSTCPSATDCSITQYVLDVNATTLCGGNNWRVPTLEELQSIINYDLMPSGKVIDPAFFPNVPTLDPTVGNLFYWTQYTSADGGGVESAWVLDFVTGNDNTQPKSSLAYVRLVRTNS
ncbi:Lcl C-terminal domain-containing protein [Algicola sagamiensis]|uniref:Lcl C-terminal domain-containing protein n=1 Tax=Algicola sagamiensis TaxID=163869 RepID=UPI00037AE3EF|nr:DUF1566 domain-containing protein [Algicola sagamiensis]